MKTLSTCWKSAPNIPDTRPSTFNIRPRVLLARPGRPPEQHQWQVQLHQDQEGDAADL